MNIVTTILMSGTSVTIQFEYSKFIFIFAIVDGVFCFNFYFLFSISNVGTVFSTTFLFEINISRPIKTDSEETSFAVCFSDYCFQTMFMCSFAVDISINSFYQYSPLLIMRCLPRITMSVLLSMAIHSVLMFLFQTENIFC